jgi:hypothetical protein
MWHTEWTQNEDYSTGRRCYNTLLILLTHPCDNDLDSQHKSQSANREDTLTAVGVGWHWLAHLVMFMVFGTFPIVGSKPQQTCQIHWKEFLKPVCVVFFVPYSLCMPQYNNEDMNKKDVWLSCLLPVAPVYIPPSDGNIHKHLPWAFTHVYAISCTATVWQRKIVAMTYRVIHIHLYLLSIIVVSLKVAPFWVYSMCSNIYAISGSTIGTERFWMVCNGQ